MKLTYLITTLMTFGFTASAFAGTLNCNVKRYVSPTGEMKVCGDYQFNLPKENDYANGTGDCEGFQMYTSWTKSEDGKAYNYGLIFSADKNKSENGTTVSYFRDAFPSRFQIQAITADANYYVLCEVKN